MSEYSVEGLRARFESAFARKEGLNLFRLDGEYSSTPTRWAFAAYQSAYAERIKADEVVVPVGTLRLELDRWNLVGSHPAIQGLSVPAGTYPVYLHPPAQAAQVDDSAVASFVERAASVICGKPFPTGHALTKAREICDLALSMLTAAEPVAQDEAAKFGHHPDPATDFCVEVEAILGEIENHRIGFENGTPTRAELDARIERALSFRVGGDPHAVVAKQQLRAATIAEPVSHRQMVPLAAFEPALVALRRTAECFNDENDANVSRAMFDALTTIGWLEKTGRRLWSITTLGESALAAQPRAVPDDKYRLDLLQNEIVDTIYMDDGRIIDVRGLDVRKAIDEFAAAPSPGESA